jgi:hypothetical protein
VNPSNEKKPATPPAQDPGRSANAETEEDIEDPVRIRPFEGPAGTPGHSGGGHIIHPVTRKDPYPGVHVH